MLHELACRDELTGLYNRREIDRMLREEVARSQRYSHVVSLIMMDVDHFKQVNDTYGHQMGDEVLRQVAELVRGHVRLGDRVGRYGGEELAIMLSETTGRDAYDTAERIRNAIAGHIFAWGEPYEQHLSVQVTASMGVASFPSHATSLDTLVAEADRALYSAKDQGRNRTVLARAGTFSTGLLNED